MMGEELPRSASLIECCPHTKRQTDLRVSTSKFDRNLSLFLNDENLGNKLYKPAINDLRPNLSEPNILLDHSPHHIDESLTLYPLSYPPFNQWKDGLKLFCQSSEPPVILVDMDNTIANWEAQFEKLMAQYHPNIPIVPPQLRRKFKIELNYDSQHHTPILHLTSLEEFWFSMEPVKGAVDAIKEMESMGFNVFIVTTPDAEHTSRCAAEKIAWVEKYLGYSWKYRSILTSDKTLVKGDILIDDRPEASIGLLQPTWTHVLFSQPYNENLSCPRLESWSEWGIMLYRILVHREVKKNRYLSYKFFSPACSDTQES